MGKPDLFGGGSSIYDTQEVYTQSGLQPGTVGILRGRSYVWCSHTGASALTRGEPLVTAPLNRTTQSLDITTTGLVIGQTRIVDITAGEAAIAANAFNEGLMAVVDGGGEGHAYEIERSSAFTAATADGELILRDPIAVASDANTQVTLIQNKYVDPIQSYAFASPSVLEGNAFIGVPNVAVPAGDSTAQYFWVQRTGYCPAFVRGTARKGTAVKMATDTPGRLEALTADVEVAESLSGGSVTVIPFETTQVVGVMATDAIDGEVQIVDLQNTIV
jgi:hypothetical protein